MNVWLDINPYYTNVMRQHHIQLTKKLLSRTAEIKTRPQDEHRPQYTTVLYLPAPVTFHKRNFIQSYLPYLYQTARTHNNDLFQQGTSIRALFLFGRKRKWGQIKFIPDLLSIQDRHSESVKVSKIMTLRSLV